MLKGEDIICVSWLYWDEIPLVMHHMMTRLAAHNRILWIDPPFPLTLFITNPRLNRLHKEKVKKWWRGINKVTDNFWVYYPIPLPLFYGRINLVDYLNRKILSKIIFKFAKKLNFNSPIFWLYHPYALLPRGEFNEKLVCYDCNDDMGAFFHRLPYQRKRLSDLEAQLIRRADVVFTTSQHLYQSKKILNQSTYYFPSGADIAVFSRASLPATEISNEMLNIKKPIIGFTGGIANDKMNWDWIKKAADAHPDWSFVFIGPYHDRLPPEITGLSNIHFLGKKPMEELPKYIKAFDVCIIPYKGSEFMMNSFPTKTFEYLAGGKPVVSSDIPALREFQPVVKLCRSSEEFIAKVEESVKESDDARLQQERFEIAKDHTWDARVEKTSSVIKEFLNIKRDKDMKESG
ncbi:hypothetical protein A2985_00790 [Candidatus Woesebacteria bacterium RIFCSPLOWO2_01_FULL_43_11]|nr:MAG: hypothetical protein A2985_00790 [Candidatus Woesebacteria bacterium RIFCSPLOWO2_01_FULL_43_11]